MSLNLSHRENLAVRVFQQSLDRVWQVARDDDQLALSLLENPKETIVQLRKSLEQLRSASTELNSFLATLVPPSTLREEATHNLMKQQFKEAFATHCARNPAPQQTSPLLDFEANFAPAIPGESVVVVLAHSKRVLSNNSLESPSSKRKRQEQGQQQQQQHSPSPPRRLLDTTNNNMQKSSPSASFFASLNSGSDKNSDSDEDGSSSGSSGSSSDDENDDRAFNASLDDPFLSTKDRQTLRKKHREEQRRIQRQQQQRHNNNSSGKHHHHKNNHNGSSNNLLDFHNPTTYLSCGVYFLLELLARCTLSREIVLYASLPGSGRATPVQVLATRPSLQDLWAPITAAESPILKCINTGLAINVAPEWPSATNEAQLVVPICAPGRSTVVVGALFLRARISGCFSRAEERITAAVAELAAPIVTPTSWLRGQGGVAIPTTLQPAIANALPVRGRVLPLLGQSTMMSASHSSSPYSATNSSSDFARQQHLEAASWDPFHPAVRTAPWSVITFLETLASPHYSSQLERVRKQKLQEAGVGGNNTGRSSQHSANNKNIEAQIAVDAALNSSLRGSLVDNSSSGALGGSSSGGNATARVVAASPAHTLLRQMVSSLHEEHVKELAMRSEAAMLMNSSPSSGGGGAAGAAAAASGSVMHSLKRVSSLLEESAKLGSRRVSNMSSDSKDTNNSPSGRRQQQQQQQKELETLRAFSRELKMSGLIAPDHLADLVDEVEVPLLVFRTAVNPDGASGGSQQQQQALSWCPSQQATTAAKNTVAQQQQQRTATGYSESISTTISTHDPLDVASHVNKLEKAWRNSIQESRAGDFAHLSALSAASRMQHQQTTLERQRDQARAQSEALAKKYAALKNQISLLVCNNQQQQPSSSSLPAINVPQQQQQHAHAQQQPGSPRGSLSPRFRE